MHQLHQHSSLTTILFIDSSFTVGYCVAQNQTTVDTGIVAVNLRLEATTQLNGLIIAIGAVGDAIALGITHETIVSVIAAETDQIR